MCRMFLHEVELGRSTNTRVCFCCSLKQLVLLLCEHSVKGETRSSVELTPTELPLSMDSGPVQGIDQSGFHV